MNLPPSGSTGVDSDRFTAYQMGADIARSRMAIEQPLQAEALEAVQAADIVVVEGCYDHVEQVLGALDVPFTVVPEGHLATAGLNPDQLLVVNCPGNMTEAEIVAVRDFVAAGGTLFTTDWALTNVIERAFPGHVAYNGRSTGDDVVRIDVLETDSPYLQGVLDADDDPQWWLEGSSYPVRVLDDERVRVLIRSAELGEKYGEDAVAVVFAYGKGEVFHMISHYYLQRTELRTERHQRSAASYAAEKGGSIRESLWQEANLSSLGDVESAATSARMMANIVADKKSRRMAERMADPDEQWEPIDW